MSMLIPDDLERFTILAAVFCVLSFMLFLSYLRRWSRDRYARRHPGSIRPSLGRFGGRFLLSFVATVIGILAILLAIQLRDWKEFERSTSIGRVIAKSEGSTMKVDLKLWGVPERKVDLKGRYWAVRGDLIAFHERWRVLGLRSYFRLRSIEGMAAPGDRIIGKTLSREDLMPPSPLFKLVQKLPAMPWLYTARSDVSPAKQPPGDVQIFATPGGMGG